MTDLTPESEALLEDVHGTQMALVVYPARLAAIEAAAAARATAPLRAERDGLRRDLATFTEEPGILARVGAQHTTYWYNQTRVADERARKAEAERDALRAHSLRMEAALFGEHVKVPGLRHVSCSICDLLPDTRDDMDLSARYRAALTPEKSPSASANPLDTAPAASGERCAFTFSRIYGRRVYHEQCGKTRDQHKEFDHPFQPAEPEGGAA